MSDSAFISATAIKFPFVGVVTSDFAIIIFIVGLFLLKNLFGATTRRLIELLSTEVFLSYSWFRISAVVECRYACIIGRRMSSGSP